MAIISQVSDYKSVVGWYGSCAEIDCNDLDLVNYGQYISSIFQWTESGLLKVWKSGIPSGLNVFNTLECGKLYYFNIKPGSNSFTIPNLVLSTFESKSNGLITSSCSPTPTPTPTPTPEKVDCCPTGFTSVTTTGGQAEEIYYDEYDEVYFKWQGFSKDGTLCVDTIKTQSSSINNFASKIYIALPENPQSAIGTFTKNLSNTESTKFYYTSPSDNCYLGYSDTSDQDSKGEYYEQPYVLTLLGAGQKPPVNEKTPTPTPEKTPTPKNIPTQLSFRWKTINLTEFGTREVLQVKGLAKPTHSNFSEKDTENTYFTIYGYTGNDEAYTLADAFWPDSAVDANYEDYHTIPSFDGMMFALGDAEVDTITSTQYKQLKLSLSDNSEFSHDSSETSPSTLFLYKEDTSDTAMGASSVWPVILKKLSPTPTPIDENCKCGDESDSDFTMTSLNVYSNSVTYKNFKQNSVLSYDESTLLADGIASNVYFNFTDGESAGYMTISGRVPNNTNFNLKYQNKCYSGTADDSTRLSGSSSWVVTLNETSTLPSGCDDGDTHTPTPNNGSIDFAKLTTEYENSPTNVREPIQIIASIIKVELLGGFYGLSLPSVSGGKNFIPLNIQTELIGMEGREIDIKSGFTRTDIMGTEMWGDYLYISEYTILSYKTTITSDAIKGDTIIQISDSEQSNFIVGQKIVIDKGLASEEYNEIVNFGSLVLKYPLKYNHTTGATIQIVSDEDYPTPKPEECCVDGSNKIVVTNGLSEQVEGISLKSHSNGKGDGELCFVGSDLQPMDGSTGDIIFSLQGVTDTEMKIKLTHTTNIENIEFSYKLASTGECYRGYMNNTNVELVKVV